METLVLFPVASLSSLVDKSPDVQPPRNDRRTLKLSKSIEQGYGFWLQTYDFGKSGSVKKKKTFVRYVEDEGPAYLAGLRAGDVIIEVNGEDLEDFEHMKIVGLISETTRELKLVVKFMDMLRRVELAMQLKNRQTKLKIKLDELEKLKDDEKKILDNGEECECPRDEVSRLSSFTTMSAYSSTYSSSFDVDFDRLSLNSSSESGIGSLSSIADEVYVRTSKFEKRSSRVLDSIKELSCVALYAQRININPPENDHSYTNTDNEWFKQFLDQREMDNKVRTSVKRTESMPVQKRNSLPLPDLSLETISTKSFPVSTEYNNQNEILSNDDMLYNIKFGNDDVESRDSDDILYQKKMAKNSIFYRKSLDRGTRNLLTESYNKSIELGGIEYSYLNEKE